MAKKIGLNIALLIVAAAFALVACVEIIASNTIDWLHDYGDRLAARLKEGS